MNYYVTVYLFAAIILLGLMISRCFGSDEHDELRVGEPLVKSPPPLILPRPVIYVLAKCIRVGDFIHTKEVRADIFTYTFDKYRFASCQNLNAILHCSSQGYYLFIDEVLISLTSPEITLLNEAFMFHAAETERKRQERAATYFAQIEKYIPCPPPNSSSPTSTH